MHHMPYQFQLAKRERGTHKLHLQPRLLLRKRRHVHFMRRRHVQKRHGHCGLHRLRGRDILDNSRRYGCGDVLYVPCQFQLAYFQLSPRCLQMQRRLHRPRRRRVHRLHSWKIQNYDRYVRVHILRNRHILANSGRNDFRDLHRVSGKLRRYVPYMHFCD